MYRFVRVQNQKIITNDCDPENSEALIVGCFAYCRADVRRRLLGWFRCQRPHYIKFEFEDDAVIITNRVLPRKRRVNRRASA